MADDDVYTIHVYLLFIYILEIIDTKKGEVISWEIIKDDFEEAFAWLDDFHANNNLDFEITLVTKQINTVMKRRLLALLVVVGAMSLTACQEDPESI